MLMIAIMMTDVVHVQNSISPTQELYYGILFGALITSVFWYFIVNFRKAETNEKLTS